ncbi:hypothetical protein [Hymenobacter volaticus]|uniref:Uncharacterized protein n=1 Tax=Hymenobacter volaticus TaxID=2932254 RepID=A0ABY4GF11_9BACT|nr:hypothetical protein [Hymenobacter volaticus]UOQ69510.1 hypothetical protein MUN86_28120 [Hymenobacter volaticus]
MKLKLTFSEFLNVFVPVITFFLGVIITTVIENRKDKQEKIEQYVNNTSELTNDWYHQLYQLNYDNKRRIDSVEIKRAMFFYSQNRLILPKIMKNLEVLKGASSCKEFVSKTERFLKLVTNYKEKSDNIAVRCNDIFLSRDQVLLIRHNEQSKLDDILLSLDTLNQHINVTAGNFLR